MTTAWLITPDDSDRDQRRIAAAVTRRGARHGDRVVFTLPNSPLLLAAILGLGRIGVVPVLLNPGLTPGELEPLIEDADPAQVFRTPDALGDLAAADAPAVDLNDVPLCRPMHYTSGTSGRPKGVWPGVLDDAAAQKLHEDEARVWNLGPEHTQLTCSPLYHSVAVRFSGQALLRGASVVLLERFDAHAAAAAITEHGVRAAFMVPTHLQRLLALPELPDLSAIHLLAHAGAACPHPLKLRLFETFPEHAVWEFYGSTEGQYTVCPPDEWWSHQGSVGRARPGREITVDEAGQIWSTAPSFARWSYWRDEVKTRAAWQGDRFTVGDLGRLDDDGYLFLDGRRDDLIISGGVNVYPAEVEQALLATPGVREVAVFGVADDEWGQRVCAAVVGEVTPGAVHARAREALAGYKRPKDVFIVGDLPHTATGKVRRTHIAGILGLASEG